MKNTYKLAKKPIFIKKGDSFKTLFFATTFLLLSSSFPILGKSFSLSTAFDSDNYADGNMFDVQVTNSVTITGFEINVLTDREIMVYYKEGTHIGSEGNPLDWTLLGTINVISAGQDNPTPLPIGGLTLIGGKTYAFYIANTDESLGGFRYTTGTAIGNVLASDANLAILEGTGIDDDFGVGCLHPTRSWNGTIRYKIYTIPTLSEWGLIILALLLMNLGALYLVQPSVGSGSGQE